MVSRHWHGMNGSAGLFLLKNERQEKLTSSDYLLISLKAFEDRAVGLDVLIDKFFFGVVSRVV